MASLTPQEIIYYILALLIGLVFHEFMHAYTGHLLGDTTAQEENRLTLNPLSHIDPLMTLLLPALTLVIFGLPLLAAKPVPFNPYRVRYGEFGAAMVAAAGPLSNLLLAIIAAIMLKTAVGSGVLAAFLTSFVFINVAIFVFNILPIPPLDGSRVLYALAPEPVQRLMNNVEPYGLFIIFALVLTGGLGGVLNGLNQSILNLLP